MSRNLNMTQGNPLKLLLRFSLPLMFGNVFQQLYMVVDTAIVGKGVGMAALAALGGVDWLNWLMLGIAQGFTQGFSVRISQKFGEGDQNGLRLFMGQSAIISAVLALLCVLLGQVALPAFLTFLRVPGELRGMASMYTRIIFAGLPAVFFFNYCSAMLRAVGNSKTPLVAMAVASVVNIALDIVAVIVLKWGIAGAAIATVIAQCLSGDGADAPRFCRGVPQKRLRNARKIKSASLYGMRMLLFRMPRTSKNRAEKPSCQARLYRVFEGKERTVMADRKSVV